MNFMTSEEFQYSRNGEWVQFDENLATAELTNFCVNQLGEVLFLDLPEEGQLVRQGEVAAEMEKNPG